MSADAIVTEVAGLTISHGVRGWIVNHTASGCYVLVAKSQAKALKSVAEIGKLNIDWSLPEDKLKEQMPLFWREMEAIIEKYMCR